MNEKNNYGRAALDLAENCDDTVKNKNEEVKAALRQHGVKHSFFYAADMGMFEVAADLIKEGTDVNEKDHNGRTSLHRASRSGHPAVVQALLKAGADIEAKDEDGRTALDKSEDCPDKVKNEGGGQGTAQGRAQGQVLAAGGGPSRRRRVGGRAHRPGRRSCADGHGERKRKLVIRPDDQMLRRFGITNPQTPEKSHRHQQHTYIFLLILTSTRDQHRSSGDLLIKG